MRIGHDYRVLQLRQDPHRVQSLMTVERLSTARFESIFRDMIAFGSLDLVFEDGAEVVVTHAIGVDVVVLAAREGPALIWPAGLNVTPDVADAIEEYVTPWLLTLTRGRTLAGEHVRRYRESPTFEAARSRKMYGAAALGETLPQLAPFVYARRFARESDVLVCCAQGPLACAVVGTVARSVGFVGSVDRVAERWYGRPVAFERNRQPDLAIVDDFDQAAESGARYVVTTRAQPGARTVIVPIPVPYDHLFTFDPADAPAATCFAVRAPDDVPRPPRATEIPASVGGSGGKVALVVRDDAFVARDADLDAVDELARRLAAEGLEPVIMTAGDARLAAAGLVHVFGGSTDAHVATATAAARLAGVPFVISVEPLGPYAQYYEDAMIGTLLLDADAAERSDFLRMFYGGRLLFNETGFEPAPGVAASRDRTFESACAGALGVILAPGEDAAAFSTRFPQLASVVIAGIPAILAPEIAAARIVETLPARPFLLVHAPFTRRSAISHVLLAAGDAPLGVVVAGPVSEVDIAINLRRIAGPDVIFFPDPTEAEIAALYARARAVAFPALRPPGAGRLIRAALCGALPLVASTSPLARLVPPAVHFDPLSLSATKATLDATLSADCAPAVERIARQLRPLADQRAAFSAIVEVYARAAVPALS